MATSQELETLFGLQDETLSTEFKAWLDLATPHGRATIAKSTIAMANHGGGTIIMGMGGKPATSTKRPDEFARYTADAVNAAVNRYADPKISCEVLHLNHPATGHEHALILVSGGTSVPVMSVKELPGTIAQQRCYIRKPGPKSEEPYTAEEWRGLLNRCVQNGRDNLLDSIRTIFYGLQPATEQPVVNKLRDFSDQALARWEVLTKPLSPTEPARMPLGSYELGFEIEHVRPQETVQQLYRLFEDAHQIKHTGWSQFVVLNRQPIAPAAVDGFLEAWLGTLEESGRNGRYVDFWRASKDGRLFLKRSLDEDFHSKYKPGTIFSLTTPIWRVGDAALFVSRLAKLMGGNPGVLMEGRYVGLQGRALSVIDEDRAPMSFARKSRTDAVSIRFDASADEIQNNTVEVLRPALLPLYEAFDLYTPPMELFIQEVAKLKAGRF